VNCPKMWSVGPFKERGFQEHRMRLFCPVCEQRGDVDQSKVFAVHR
jgi:hypothetical protein